MVSNPTWAERNPALAMGTGPTCGGMLGTRTEPWWLTVRRPETTSERISVRRLLAYDDSAVPFLQRRHAGAGMSYREEAIAPQARAVCVHRVPPSRGAAGCEVAI